MAIVTCITLLVLSIAVGISSSVDLYPGYGWDHLRFMDMLPIYSVRNLNKSSDMQQCTAQIPMRASEIDVNSDIIDIYNVSTTDYASEFTINGEVNTLKFGIGGSFSKLYRTIKQQQGRENTVTIRNEIRYILAEVLLLRSCPLDSQFKSEVLKIATYIKTEQPRMATYAAQLFVLRYGTHYTSRIRIGGHIVEENFIKRKELSTNDTIKKSYQVSAKASFLVKFGLSAGYGVQNVTSELKAYEEQVTERRILSDGGDPFFLGMPLQQWQLTIDDKPVILQRSFENITMAIDPKQITEVEEFYVVEANKEINRAIDTYVKMNSIYGCMDRSSTAFNWLANVNDGSCAPNVTDISP